LGQEAIEDRIMDQLIPLQATQCARKLLHQLAALRAREKITFTIPQRRGEIV
jgi:hypothetical protein